MPAPAAARPAPHPHASLLRQRAAALRELAATIERSLVLTLGDIDLRAPGDHARVRLAGAILARNLHQLHQAADDLRFTAFRLAARAGELERARRGTAE